ncbi:hypothetical protein D3C74_182400 [compost metagenome]
MVLVCFFPLYCIDELAKRINNAAITGFQYHQTYTDIPLFPFLFHFANRFIIHTHIYGNHIVRQGFGIADRIHNDSRNTCHRNNNRISFHHRFILGNINAQLFSRIFVMPIDLHKEIQNQRQEDKDYPHLAKLGEDKDKRNRQRGQHPNRINSKFDDPAWRFELDPANHHTKL